MTTITIDGTDYDVYADVATADAYLGGAIAADGWRAPDADTKGRALVSATRWLDELSWIGTKTSSSQPLDWPRTGISGVADDAVPGSVVNASIELASILVDDSEAKTTFTDAAAKRLKAGSVEIEFFRGASVQTTTVLPTGVIKMVREWLDGTSSGGRFGAPVSYGTCKTSDFETGYGYTEGL